MDKEEFEKRIDCLKKVVSSDEMYHLGYQMLLASEFFLQKWMEWVNIEEEMARDAKGSVCI